ncbi:hypothetical protein K1719_030969 [Acacia pycnantha]|nr:hypothetical protein K1719_030969 [Acacia pycnantha]
MAMAKYFGALIHNSNSDHDQLLPPPIPVSPPPSEPSATSRASRPPATPVFVVSNILIFPPSPLPSKTLTTPNLSLTAMALVGDEEIHLVAMPNGAEKAMEETKMKQTKEDEQKLEEMEKHS